MLREEVVVAMLAQGLGRGVASKALGSLVPIGDAAFSIDKVDTIVEAIEQATVEGGVAVCGGGSDVRVERFVRDLDTYASAK